MTLSEQVRILRVMARAEWLSVPYRGKQNVDHHRALAAALTAGAEALEAMSAAAPTAQKAEILLSLADTADKLARLDCGLVDRAVCAQRAALFRECAAMMRERCKPKDPWYLVHERVYKRFDISVTEALHGYWHWMVEGDGCIKRGAEVGLVAAQAAAIAWVDGNEARYGDIEDKNGKS